MIRPRVKARSRYISYSFLYSFFCLWNSRKSSLVYLSPTPNSRILGSSNSNLISVILPTVSFNLPRASCEIVDNNKYNLLSLEVLICSKCLVIISTNILSGTSISFPNFFSKETLSESR